MSEQRNAINAQVTLRLGLLTEPPMVISTATWAWSRGIRHLVMGEGSPKNQFASSWFARTRFRGDHKSRVVSVDLRYRLQYPRMILFGPASPSALSVGAISKKHNKSEQVGPGRNDKRRRLWHYLWIFKPVVLSQGPSMSLP